MPRSFRFSPDYERRSASVLEVALNQVAGYKSWQSFDPGAGCPVDERYAALPVLTKQDIREHFPYGLTPPGCRVEDGLARKEIEFVKTSGSSDAVVTNIWNQQWWNASERASWQLNSHARRIATGDHPEAILANPRNVGFISDDADLSMDRRRLGRFLYLNEKTDPATWTPRLMDRMVNELETHQSVVLEANPTLLARLCRYVAARGKPVYQPGLIVLTYELPAKLHLQQIKNVFTSPVASSYGTTETGYVFMQCEAGKFHQNTKFCRVDFQPMKPEHGGPWLGRILVTTFNNPWYYIVRFDVGDLVRVEESGSCPCGRDSGLIASAVEGRTANVTLTTEGRLVSQRELDDTIAVLDGIEDYYLDQLSTDSYEIHLSTRRLDKRKLSSEATGALNKLYGEGAKVSVVYEEAIHPESSGKYRTSRARFSIDIEDYLEEKTVCCSTSELI